MSISEAQPNFFLSLRDCRPVDIRLAQALQLLPHHRILGSRAIGVLIGDALGDAAHMPQQLSVAGYIGNLQVEGDAALLCALEVARAAQLEVG